MESKGSSDISLTLKHNINILPSSKFRTSEGSSLPGSGSKR